MGKSEQDTKQRAIYVNEIEMQHQLQFQPNQTKTRLLLRKIKQLLRKRGKDEEETTRQEKKRRSKTRLGK